MAELKISRSVSVPEHELEYRFSTSGGPGGQHANKASTRVELIWNVDSSESLGPRQRQRVRAALRNRIDNAGNLRLASDRQRSQLQNRADVTRRFQAMLLDALTPPKHRVETKPSKAAKQRRVDEKKRRGQVKRNRRVGRDDF